MLSSTLQSYERRIASTAVSKQLCGTSHFGMSNPRTFSIEGKPINPNAPQNKTFGFVLRRNPSVSAIWCSAGSFSATSLKNGVVPILFVFGNSGWLRAKVVSIDTQLCMFGFSANLENCNMFLFVASDQMS